MATSNAAVKAMLDKYGARVKCLQFETHQVFMNFPKSARMQPNMGITNDQVKFETFGGEDFIVVPSLESKYNNPVELILPIERLVKVVVAEKETDFVDPYCIYY